ncbi:hypothetical protein [Streptomyces sp. BK340]|uniref:hypothetical protein n=1 Tax=Streptomyces sp. BK340 TaxID=2572903 RepID=UPI001647D710|nr:hypothetical protein [Streptomyces sp. BK340]
MTSAATLATPDRPRIAVVLTDGLTPWPDENPPCRIIAALNGSAAPQPPSRVETVRIPT